MARSRCIVVGLLAALLALAVAPPLAAAKLPTYRSPGYRGTTRVPRLRAQATPPAQPVELSGAGRLPDTYVDAAGTAHVVWTEDEGDGADVVRYCRLRRAARSCDVSQRLVWEKAYDVGDDPRFNVDQDGPRVVVVGDQLIVLSFRYPTIAEKPDRSDPDSTVLAWVSDDGGASFSGPAIVGNGQINGGAIAYGNQDDPTILTMNDTVTLCHSCVQVLKPGAFTSASTSLGTGADQAYSGSLALDRGTPVAAFADLGRTTFVRRLNNLAAPGDAGAWSGAFSVPGDEPTLAGGPAGAFLLNRPDFGGPFAVRALSAGGAGRATTVTDRDGPGLPDLFEDPSGRLLAGWVSSGGRRPGVRLRSSTDGRAWTDAQQLLGGASAGQLAIGATDDGGGVVALNKTGGLSAFGPIAVVPFGPRTPTRRSGLGNLLGGGDPNARSTCQDVTFGVVRIHNSIGCFFKGTGRFAAVNVTNGELDFNGLKIVPDAGVRIMVDARNHTLDTTGPVRALLRGAGDDIVLWRGPLHVELPTAAEGVPFSFPTNQFSAELKGFDVVGRIDVFLTRGGVRIPISLKLPPYLGGVTGEAVLLADGTTGLHLDSLVIDVQEAPVGPLVIKDLHIEYSGGEERWEGGARLELPPQPGGAKIRASVVFVRGAFDSGEVVLTPPFPPGLPIGPGIWLSEIGGGVRLSPLALSLIGQVGALPLTPRGPFTVTVDGRATVDFGDPLTFTFDGGGNIVDIRLSSVHLLANVNGFANARAAAEFDLGDVIAGRGSVELTVDGPGRQFLAELLVDLEIADQDFVQQRALASNVGFGGCYELLVASLGFGYRWATRTPEIMFPSCDLSGYKPVPGGGGGGGGPAGVGSSFTVRAGTPSVSLQVAGDGGLPQVVLVAPDGKRIEPLLLQPPLPTDPLIVNALRAMALPVSPTSVTIGLVKPAAGTWRIESAAGAARAAAGRPRARAAAIAGVQLATGLEPPTVSARLRGSGRTRTLAFRATRRAGLTVTFVERGRGGTRTLGRARSAGDGRLSFSTGDLPGGRRTVIALLAQDGAPRLRKTVASYVAPPPPRPARVRGVRIGRAGGGIVVRWARAAGAEAYLVRVTTGDGRRLARVVGSRTRSLRVGRVAKRYGASAVVVGRTRMGRVGPAGRAAIAAQALPRRAARAPRRR